MMPGRRREDDIKMDLQKVDTGLDRLDLAHDGDTWRALENAAINFQVPQNAGNF